jgi:hypothetical protein
MNKMLIFNLEPKDQREILFTSSDMIIFFEDEWQEKKHICNSMLQAHDGKIDIKLSARDCSIKWVTNKEAQCFLNQNHISGYVQSSLFCALEYDREIVSIIGFRKPFSRKYKNALEISRFCSLTDIVVRGALLMVEPNKIISIPMEKFDTIDLNLGHQVD